MCAGAIDGILIWMNRPTLEEVRKVGVDQQKFYCGRKHKFGLNCQVVCDVSGRFLDISITYGTSSLDLLAFENSKLYRLLEKGILAPGLVCLVIMCTSTHCAWQLLSQILVEDRKTTTIFTIRSYAYGSNVLLGCLFRDGAFYVWQCQCALL